MAGIRRIRAGDRRRRARPRRFHRGEFLQRARAGADAADLALVQGPRAGRAAVAARDPHVRRAALSRRRDRRGELDGVEALAGRRRGRRPVDDAAQIRRRQGRLCRLVLDLAGHLRRARVRLEGPDALRDRFRHLGHAGRDPQDLDALHPARQGRLRQARGAEGRRRATCSAPSWRCSPQSCRTGRAERAQRRQRQRRRRGRLCRAALDRAERPGGEASPT